MVPSLDVSALSNRSHRAEKNYFNLFTRGKDVKILYVRNAPTAAALLENLPKLLAKNPGNHCKLSVTLLSTLQGDGSSFLL